MNVLVDTSIWSQALRRGVPGDPVIVKELAELIRELRAQIIGPIRQELLSGIKSESQFERLKTYLSDFQDITLEQPDFEIAADFYNRCRRVGIQGSNTDFLICSVACSRNLAIFTTDNDFLSFQQHLSIKLYTPRTLV
jgi:predicted nucleic acid-binding protein